MTSIDLAARDAPAATEDVALPLRRGAPDGLAKLLCRAPPPLAVASPA